VQPLALRGDAATLLERPAQTAAAWH